MNEYRRINHREPPWVMLPLTVVVGLGAGGIIRAGFWDSVAGGPVFLVLAYALAAGFVNKSCVQVNWEGVRSGTGPLPAGPQSEPVRRQDIVKVYVRHTRVRTKTGSIPYLAAGVQCSDGRWMDPYLSGKADASVSREAAEIATALSWPHAVEELWGRPPKLDEVGAKLVFYWAGAVLTCLAWGCYVELFLRH